MHVLDDSILEALKASKYQKIMDDSRERVRKLCAENGIDYDDQEKLLMEELTCRK